MRIAIRVNSSSEIGGGHVMRCLSLAEAFAIREHEVIFINSDLIGNINSVIKDKGFKQINLIDSGTEFKDIDKIESANHQTEDANRIVKFCNEERIDLVVLDCYNYDHVWERIVKSNFPLMVVDDFPSRNHECHIFLDSTFGRKAIDYKNKVSAKEFLVGSKYLPIRNEFCLIRSGDEPKISDQIKKVLLTMGSVDKHNTLHRILILLTEINFNISDIEVTVLAGSSNTNLKSLQNISSNSFSKLTIIPNSKNVSDLMSNSDLIVTAAGTTLWECFCLGVPSIAVKTASNQQSNIDVCLKDNLSKVCDINKNFEVAFTDAFMELLLKSEIRKELSSNAFDAVDGKGAMRVVRLIESYYEAI
jgi:UDP-2,4-diacetamido-2,4,6-trideoxy-beta-L-altropyranose hydrolase